MDGRVAAEGTVQPGLTAVVESSTASRSTFSQASSPVDIVRVSTAAEAPDLFAIIEVGSSGIRCLVRRIPQSGESPQTIHKFSPRTVRPIAPESVEATVGEVVSLVQLLKADHSVSEKNIHIVGSSGLGEGPTSSTLANEITSKVGMPLKFVSVDDEIRFQYLGMVGAEDLERSTIIDIGGGNTKASYYQKIDGVAKIESVRLSDGVRALTTKTGATTPIEDFQQRLAAIEAGDLKTEVCNMVDKHPALATRPNVYLTGGMCWVIASALHPPDSELEDGPIVVELAHPELARWAEVIKKYPHSAYRYRKDRVRAGGEKYAEDNLRNVESAFSPAQIASGVAILRTLDSCLSFSRRGKILFNRDSLHAWPQACLDEMVAKGRSNAL